ncbi:Uncharacterised protein [Acidipropionibacterium jensenii]|uniref:Uncharacterized protein n=1 Tax=Acidipropionibacterium jensenii TaxID=1749 RepID=A0A3S4WYI1_9ACTN|nr:hypothetical protein [Acidipropionibacterium jensenii]VEI04141.1 Uncharacterised protein [Acidipropionibacterium jensenii]
MTKTTFTPSTEAVRRRYRALLDIGVSVDEADAEFDRWLAVRDQGIRDSVKPPELTAKEHLEAAWDKAHPVPKWRDVPAGVTIIARRKNGKIWVDARGWTSGLNDLVEVRTLEPLPPVIPDDCNRVFASTPEYGSRLIWIRETDDPDCWRAADGTAWIRTALTCELIDPKPVPEEES